MDLKKESAKMLAESSSAIAQLIAGKAFEFWQRKDFRMYVDFNSIGQTEQDRIFNELEVSLIGLFTIHFNQAQEGAIPEKKIVFKSLEKDLPKAFLQYMAESGIEKKYLKVWEKLIDVRLKEYNQHLKWVLKESLKSKEFDGKDADLRQDWARIETITIDCLTHIRRGKVEEKDPLWKLLRKWFITTGAIIYPLMNL